MDKLDTIFKIALKIIIVNHCNTGTCTIYRACKECNDIFEKTYHDAELIYENKLK